MTQARRSTIPASRRARARPAPVAAILVGALFALDPGRSLAADSDAVQRCEATDGKVTYANGPCPEDARVVRSLPLDTAPSAADKRAAQERTLKAKRVLETQEKIEQSRQQKAQRDQNALDRKAQALARDCGKLSLKVRFAREDLDRAAFGKRPEFERKLARAQENYEKSCKPPS